MTLYTASRTIHADKWKALRSQGIPVISTWIDEAGPNESQSLEDLWFRCISESSRADFTLCYRENGEPLKGALVEVGSALASGKTVFFVGDTHRMSFVHHPNLQVADSVEDALKQMGYLRNHD